MKANIKDVKFTDFSQERYSRSYPASDGLILVLDSNSLLYGYLDEETKKEVIPCQFYYATPFSEGKACIDTLERKPYYINRNGEKVLALDTMSSAYPFFNGIAKIITNEGQYFIDEKGRDKEVSEKEAHAWKEAYEKFLYLHKEGISLTREITNYCSSVEFLDFKESLIAHSPLELIYRKRESLNGILASLDEFKKKVLAQKDLLRGEAFYLMAPQKISSFFFIGALSQDEVTELGQKMLAKEGALSDDVSIKFEGAYEYFPHETYEYLTFSGEKCSRGYLVNDHEVMGKKELSTILRSYLAQKFSDDYIYYLSLIDDVTEEEIEALKTMISSGRK